MSAEHFVCIVDRNIYYYQSFDDLHNGNRTATTAGKKICVRKQKATHTLELIITWSRCCYFGFHLISFIVFSNNIVRLQVQVYRQSFQNLSQFCFLHLSLFCLGQRIVTVVILFRLFIQLQFSCVSSCVKWTWKHEYKMKWSDLMLTACIFDVERRRKIAVGILVCLICN